MITVSKDLAIKLKEHGYPQGDNYTKGNYWVEVWSLKDGEEKSVVSGKPLKVYYNTGEVELHDFHSNNSGKYRLIATSPTADEILENLPQIIEMSGIKYQLFISLGLDRQYFVVYADDHDYNNNAPFPIKMCHTLADILGEMWLYLKEQCLISQKEKI